jgi:hypothetical protein
MFFLTFSLDTILSWVKSTHEFVMDSGFKRSQSAWSEGLQHSLPMWQRLHLLPCPGWCFTSCCRMPK